MTSRARLGAALAAVVASLILPSAALGATTITVNPAHDGACSNNECRTITDAIALAQPGDAVEVMPGSYAESPTVDKAIEIRGSGAETKVIGSGTGDVLSLSADGAKVASLAVQVAADAQSAIVLDAPNTLVNGVVAQRTGGTEPVIDVLAGPATIQSSFVIQGSAAGTSAIRSTAAAGLKLVGAIVISSKGPAALIENSVDNSIVRSSLAATDKTANGIEVQSRANSSAPKKLTIDSSMIAGGTDAAGIYAHTFAGALLSGGPPTPSSAGSIDLLVRHATIMAGKGIIAHAEANHASTDSDHGDVKAQVLSSIVHGESRAFNYTGVPLLYSANEASVSFTTSDAPPAPSFPTVTRDAGTSFTPPGQMFRQGSFALRADAPVIDKGGVVDAGESETDIDSEPRAVDGNQDGVVVSDIGADEFNNKAPTAKFAATDTAPKQNQIVGFISAATDPEQAVGGGIVEYRWDFGDGTKVTTKEFAVGHTFTRKGAFKVTLTTVDKQGSKTVSEPLAITVRDGTAPTVSIALPAQDATYTLRQAKRKNQRRAPKPLPLGAVGVVADDEAVARVEVALTLTSRDPVKKTTTKKKKSSKKKSCKRFKSAKRKRACVAKRKAAKRRAAKRRAAKSAETCEQFTGTGFAAGGCEELRWIPVSFIGTGWTFATPDGLSIPAGRYQIRVRAVDAQGNESETPRVSRNTLVGFRIK